MAPFPTEAASSSVMLSRRDTIPPASHEDAASLLSRGDTIPPASHEGDGAATSSLRRGAQLLLPSGDVIPPASLSSRGAVVLSSATSECEGAGVVRPWGRGRGRGRECCRGGGHCRRCGVVGKRGLPTTTYERAKTSWWRGCLVPRVGSARCSCMPVLNSASFACAISFSHLILSHLFLPHLFL